MGVFVPFVSFLRADYRPSAKGEGSRETCPRPTRAPRESEWGAVSPPAPTCPSFDCRRWVARPSLAGRLLDGEAGANARFALLRIPERGREARSEPGGSRPRGLGPPPIPVGSPERDLHPAAASLSDRARRKAAPSPRARIEAETSPVARSGKSAKPKPLDIPFRIAARPEGFALLPEPFAKNEAFPSNPVRVAAGT
jgi:hypothetical protein